jgi:hypothetical protein
MTLLTRFIIPRSLSYLFINTVNISDFTTSNARVSEYLIGKNVKGNSRGVIRNNTAEIP